jgi:hypothetical protein
MKRFRNCLEAVVIAGFLFAASSSAFAQTKGQSTFAERFAGQHPRVLMLEAQKALKSGRAEDAAFLFYLGQFRWNALHSAKPETKAEAEEPSLDALNQSVGQPVNEIMLQDPGLMAAMLRGVREHELATPDRFTPIADFPDAWQKEFSEFDAFIDYVDKQAAANTMHRGPSPDDAYDEKAKP